jgi:hypothetical protein
MMKYVATDDAMFSHHLEVAADNEILICSQQVAKCQKVRGVTRQSCIMQPTHVIVSNQRRCSFTRLINLNPLDQNLKLRPI